VSKLTSTNASAWWTFYVLSLRGLSDLISNLSADVHKRSFTILYTAIYIFISPERQYKINEKQ